jgi:hypothetical protein
MYNCTRFRCFLPLVAQQRGLVQLYLNQSNDTSIVKSGYRCNIDDVKLRRL